MPESDPRSVVETLRGRRVFSQGTFLYGGQFCKSQCVGINLQGTGKGCGGVGAVGGRRKEKMEQHQKVKDIITACLLSSFQHRFKAQYDEV